jgi:hypothetical protein
VLATKNPIAYLIHLNRIRRVLPQARIAACIRNPFDTIATWKVSFDHLREARVFGRPTGSPDDPWLPEQHRAALRMIAETQDLAERRAMLWRFWAERILDQNGQIIVVHYETLITQPQTTLDQILSGYNRGILRELITPSTIRSHREALDAADMRAIRSICSQTAAELGIYL